jgi:hypothetical protein
VSVDTRARWESLSGDAHLQLAAYTQAHDHYARALHLLNRPLPSSTPRLLVMTMGQVVRQVLHRFLPASRVRWKGAEQERAERMSVIYQKLAEIAYFDQDLVPLLHATFRNLNFAERSGEWRELAPAYGTMGVTAGVCGLHPLARRYIRLAQEAAARSEHRPTVAYANLLSGVYNYSAGNWAKAPPGLQQALELFSHLGDKVRWGTAKAIQGFQAIFEGDLPTARTRLLEVLAEVEEEMSAQLRVWGLAGWLWAELTRAIPGPERVDELEALLQRHRLDSPTLVLAEGVAALARLRQGDRALARAHAESCARRLAGIPPSAPVAAIGAFAVIEACLELAAGADATEAPTFLKMARRSCLALSIIGFQNMAAGSLALLAHGLVQRARGRVRTARWFLDRCMSTAWSRRTFYVKARAHLELSELLAATHPEQVLHARSAQALLAPLDASLELRRAGEFEN